MQDINYECFEKNWKKFITQLQGRMIIQSNKGVFTFASMKLILADCIGFWDSRQYEGGRWLDEYEEKYPDKACLVRDILLNDMKFTDESTDNSRNDFLKYAVPVGSAIAGFAIARTVGTNNMVQAVCTIFPAAVSYPITNNIISEVEDTQKKEKIQVYLRQLDKFKLGIESILQNT